MKLHIITIGQPKLKFAKQGWDEYLTRLKHFHKVRTTPIADKHNNATSILHAAGNAYKIALVIDGPQLSSEALAAFLEQQAQTGRELCWIIGGPDGLPAEVINKADKLLGLSQLTFPHDLAMVILAEALYRASTISAGHPYHRD